MARQQADGRRTDHPNGPRPSPLKRPEFRNLLALSTTVALGFGMIVPVLPLFARSFGVGLAAVGLVQFVFGLTRFSFGPVGGLVVDRFGERACTMTGLLIVAASSFAIGFADNFTQLVVARGFGGAGSAMFVGGLMNHVLRIIEPESMGRATGIFRSSFLVGIGAGPVIGGFVGGIFGLSAPFFFYGGVLLLATAIGWFVMSAPTEAERPRRSPLEALRAAKPLFGNVRYTVALAATFIGWWTISGPTQVVGSVFAREQLGFSPGMIGLGLTLLSVGEIGTLYFAGRASDRIGRRAVLLPSLVVTGLATAALGLVEPVPLLFYPVLVAIGIGIAAGGAATGGLLADALPAKGSGAAVGVNQMAGDLGYLIAPVALGALAEGTSFSLAYFVAAVPAALVLAYALRLPGGVGRVKQEELPVEPEPVG